MQVNMRNFFGYEPVVVKDPPPFWLAVVNQNWEAAEKCLELKDVEYNFHPDNWRITPKATPIELAIHYGNWDFVSKILNKFPTALSEGVVFNQKPDYKPQIQIQINPVDEILILEILQNKNIVIPPHFVSNLLSAAALRGDQPQWEFIKKILICSSDDVLSSLLEFRYMFESNYPNIALLSQFYQFVFDHAQEHHFPWLENHLKDFLHMSAHFQSVEIVDKLLNFGDKGIFTVLDLFCDHRTFFSSHLPHIKKKILQLKTVFSKEEIIKLVNIGQLHDEPLMLKMFKRYPKTEIDDLFHGGTKETRKLLKLAKEYSFVKEVIETNMHNLMDGCFGNLLLECDGVFKEDGALDLLTEVLEMFPECDIHFYTDEIFESLFGSRHPKNRQALKLILQHAKQRNDTSYLEKYEEKIEGVLLPYAKKRKI